MKNKERQADRLPASDVLKKILNIAEIKRRAKTVQTMNYILDSSLVFNKAQNIVDRWGSKDTGISSAQYSRTEPVRLSVNNEQVDLMIQSEGRKKFDILARIVGGMDQKNPPILFSIDFGHTIWVENRIGEEATLGEVDSTLGLLSFMEESLSKIPQKTTEAKI